MKLFSRFSRLSKKVHTVTKTFTIREWAVFFALSGLLIFGSVSILGRINRMFMVEIPVSGGSIKEGIIGTPRFINPVLAFSDVDRDLSSLVYSGLMRYDTNGTLVHDLAESHTVSADGLIYTFILKENAVFHDGTPVTAEDIVFTVTKTQDPLIKSPRRPSWEGITVTAIDERTVQFTLKQRFGAFLDTATMGILPSHLWGDISAEEFSFTDLNTQPVGSGPYKMVSVSKENGIPTRYTLRAFSDFLLGKPYIRTMRVHFYANEKELVAALRKGTVDMANAITPKTAEELSNNGYTIDTTLLPRTFAVFYNQNKNPIFRDKAVLEAFDSAINREEIVNQVLHGYGTPLSVPLPETDTVSTFNPDRAIEILDKAGWKVGDDGIRTKAKERLTFTLATGDTPELSESASLIKTQLALIGAEVTIQLYDVGTLNQNVIRPREYESVLFGQVVSHDSDLFAFWHSSQRNDPGLNIALYANARADSALEKMLLLENPEDRKAEYEKFKTELKKDRAALFLYAPDFIYVVDTDIKGMSEEYIRTSSDRFLNVYTWYKETDYIWKFFIRKNN